MSDDVEAETVQATNIVFDREPEEARSMGGLLKVLEDGRFDGYAMDKMKGLLEEMRMAFINGQRKVSGEVTISLRVDYVDGEGYDVRAAVKVKAPKEPGRPRSVLYPTSGGSMSARNPRQQELALRSVAGGGAIRTVG